MPVANITDGVLTQVRPYDVRLTDVLPGEKITVTNEPAVENPFGSFFNAAMDALEETNGYKLTADQQQIDLATGKTDDILTVLLAQDKAYSALNFTVQVTNKIIESYREIMRMQI